MDVVCAGRNLQYFGCHAGPRRLCTRIALGALNADPGVTTEPRGLKETTSRLADLFTTFAVPGRGANLDVRAASSSAAAARGDAAQAACDWKTSHYRREIPVLRVRRRTRKPSAGNLSRMHDFPLGSTLRPTANAAGADAGIPWRAPNCADDVLLRVPRVARLLWLEGGHDVRCDAGRPRPRGGARHDEGARRGPQDRRPMSAWT